MKKIKTKKNLLTKTSLGVAAASLMVTPIVTAVACGADNIKPTPDTVPWTKVNPSIEIRNTFEGTFSTPEKEAEFYAITNEIPNDSFMNETGLISVNLPDVITVGENAFAMDAPDEGNSLIKVTLPKVETIKYNAFHNANVTAIDFPNATSLGTELFNQSKLTSIKLAKMTVIENQFRNVVFLTELIMPKLVEVKANAFSRVSALETLSLPELKTVADFGFSAAPIKSLSIPKIETVATSGFGSATLENTLTFVANNATAFYDNSFQSAQITSLEINNISSIWIGAFRTAPLRTIKIEELHIANLENLSFYNAAVGVEVFVKDRTTWVNNERLQWIFGPNFASIVFQNA